jgi:hypothetical protein
MIFEFLVELADLIGSIIWAFSDGGVKVTKRN